MDRSLLIQETIADIAYLAGKHELYSGNSRADMRTFISWAEEFEKETDNVDWDNDVHRDYIIEVEEFFHKKAAEFESSETPK